MNSFLRTNKNLVTYSLLFLLVIPIFGLNFLIQFIGNILLLLILLPLLILLILFISFNSLKSKINTCNQCGIISLGFTKNCINCGAKLNVSDFEDNESVNNPSERTIEIKAEEIQ